MGLFGEVELGKSRGHTDVCQPVFVKPNQICYVSGNCINCIDTAYFTPIDRTVPEIVDIEVAKNGDLVVPRDAMLGQHLVGQFNFEAHTKVVVADAQIAAFAVYARDSIVAYVELGSSVVKLVKWTQGAATITTPIGTVEVESETPTSNILATLRHESRPGTEELEQQKIQPYQHVWDSTHKAVCSSESGDEVYHFDPDTGACEILFSSKRDVVSLEPKLVDLANDMYGPTGSYKCVAINAHGYILGGQDGIVRMISNHGTLVGAINATKGVPIAGLIISPDFKQVLVLSTNTRIYVLNLIKERNTLAVSDDTHDIIGTAAYALASKCVTMSRNGLMQFWDIDKHALIRRFATASTPSCLAISPVSFLLGVGSKTGHVRIYDTDWSQNPVPRLVLRSKTHKGPVKKVSFESGGKYMLSASEDGYVFLYDVIQTFKVIGYLLIPGKLMDAVWHFEEIEDKEPILRLYALSYEEMPECTLIYRFEFPHGQNLSGSGDDGLRIAKSQYQRSQTQGDDGSIKSFNNI
eukprot:jgi/Hompol1/4906/HPOL_004016-RA